MTGTIAALIVAATAGTSEAQVAPRVELGGGYVALVRGDALPTGLYVSAATRVTRRWSVVGEASWHWKLDRFERSTAEETINALLGGGRFVPWSSNRLTLFADLLVGTARDRLHVKERDPSPAFPEFDVEIRATSVALQPGAGMSFWVRPRLALQALVQYRRTFDRSVHGFGLRDFHETKFAAGLVAGF